MEECLNKELVKNANLAYFNQEYPGLRIRAIETQSIDGVVYEFVSDIRRKGIMATTGTKTTLITDRRLPIHKTVSRFYKLHTEATTNGHVNNLDDKLREIIGYCAESYYPEHEYGNTHKEQNQKYLEEAVGRIIQVFQDYGVPPKVSDGTLYPLLLKEKNGWMTGQEWYNRFVYEAKHTGYFNEDLSLCIAAKRASGIDTETKK